MRKIIFTLLVIIPLVMQQFVADAQFFRAGISAGFVATDVYNSDIYDRDNDFHKAGFMVGGAVGAALNEKVTLQFEMNYIQKGTQQPSDQNGYGFYRFSFNYLEFPLLLKYRFRFNVGKKPVKGFNIHAGISLGKLMSNKAQGDNFNSNNDDNYVNKTDVSLLAGLGYNFSEHFTFVFRYSNSIIPVFKRNSAAPVFFGSTYNNGNNMVLHFILQYQFSGVKTIPVPTGGSGN